jgi:hypothetical protein
MPDRKRGGLVLALVLLGSLVLLLPALSESRDESKPAGKGAAVVSVGKTLHLTEPVDGSVQSFGGPVEIDTVVRGDVLSIGGHVTIGAMGRVEGDVVVLGGTVTRDTDATVTGSVVQPLWIGDALRKIPNGSDFLDAVDRRFSLLIVALKMSVLLVWLGIAVVLALAGGREIRSSSLELRANPFHTLTVGLVGFTSLVLTAIVFGYLVPYLVGLPLLVALGVFAVVAKVYGMIAVFHAVGWLLFAPKTRDAIDRRRYLKGDLAMVVLGLLVLGIIRMIPVVGGIIWMIASLMGLGSALATKFGRREPWFVAAVQTSRA